MLIRQGSPNLRSLAGCAWNSEPWHALPPPKNKNELDREQFQPLIVDVPILRASFFEDAHRFSDVYIRARLPKVPTNPRGIGHQTASTWSRYHKYTLGSLLDVPLRTALFVRGILLRSCSILFRRRQAPKFPNSVRPILRRSGPPRGGYRLPSYTVINKRPSW
jgi:hypothetical protein